MVLDAANLDAILHEARSCFLYEDAPDYLVMLEQNVQRLFVPTPGGHKSEYTALMRAAHSLKGGAGIAHLLSLQQLSHKLEDLLQALDEGRVQAKEEAYELLTLGVEQVKDLVADAVTKHNSGINPDLNPATIPINAALEQFLQELPKHTANQDEANQTNTINPYILKTALEFDLAECLQRVEVLLQPPVQLKVLQQGLTTLVEECTLLGQTLNLTWLVDTADQIFQAIGEANPPLERIAKTAITQLQQLRSQTLNPVAKVEAEPKDIQLKDASIPAQITPTLNLRIPVTRLNRMNNTLGELLISHERLFLYQSQLFDSNLSLKKEAQKLNPINDQVRVFYDQLATPLASSLGTTNNSEFDVLQFDQYTSFHTTLQDLQEVMVRVQESRSDIDLITRELQQAIDQLRLQLDSLRGDLTQSRLVPFKFLAERFVTPLETLNQRYHKLVELKILGEDILIDQVILEQLQTPLTHLLRNAFDHGIETTVERLALGKPKTAQITLSAAVQGNQVIIAIADDGCGIASDKVYQKAVQMGLYQGDAAALTKEQISEFLFVPGFSTANDVTDLSGRGVGLDVVRLQVERLRGTVQVETKLQQGTKFTITIPLTLSILPLLLCRCQQRTLAIPSINILEIIALSEFYDSSSDLDAIIWQNRRVPLYSLIDLLPYTQDSVSSSLPFDHKLGIVLDVGGEAVVVAVNSLLGERELVLKPFDATVKVPAYVAGCTVLGTGEVVTVLSPNNFGGLIAHKKPVRHSIATSVQEPKLSPKHHTVAQQLSSILIVDDSIAVRRLLDRILNQSGYHVVQCRDGKEALEELNRSEHYDLVISDIEMPRLDGFSLLREIRTDSRWHHLPVFMLTSRENDQHRQKAKDLGATAYFTKPFHPTDLLNVIAARLKQ